jgi:hypothetical protein
MENGSYFPFGKRLMNKKIFAMAALDILRKALLASVGDKVDGRRG